MTEGRKLREGEESGGRSPLALRLSAVGASVLTALFIMFVYRAKHDPAISSVNPFAGDPYDAVGSFGIQLGFICAIIAVVRAFRMDPNAKSTTSRHTFTLRAMAVSQFAIIVTMLGDVTALVRNTSLWHVSPDGRLLFHLTAGLLLLSSGFCVHLKQTARRMNVCGQGFVNQPQILPFFLCLILLGVYPEGWREGNAGAILTCAFGMVVLFGSVALLSKAMFPCPDELGNDLIDDLQGIYQQLKPRSGCPGRVATSFERTAELPLIRKIIDLFNPRRHEWNLLAFMAILLGFLLGIAEIFNDGPSRDVEHVLLVTGVYVVIETAGVFLGYVLLRRFLGLLRPAR